MPAALNFFGDELAEAAFRAAVQRLRTLNVALVDIDFAPFAELAALLYQGPWVAERYLTMERLLRTDPDAVNPVVRQIASGAARFSAADAFKAEYRRAELAREIDRILSEVDALVVPTTPTIYTIAAVQNDPLTLNSRLGTYTNFTNLADLAALALPADFRSDGLPAGITLIARAGRDHALAAYGKRWQRATGLPLGATGRAAEESLGADATVVEPLRAVRIAVVGAHLTGLPLNHQLTTRGARFVERCRTAACYRLFALPNTTPPKPGLARHEQGQSIEVELWDLPSGASRFVRCRDSRSAWARHARARGRPHGERIHLRAVRPRRSPRHHRVRRLARVSRRFRRAAHLSDRTTAAAASGGLAHAASSIPALTMNCSTTSSPRRSLMFVNTHGPLAAHLQRVALHDVERRADHRREIDLVDDQQVGAHDAGAALARNLVAAPRRR